jgi:CheY-like chemotaxis protein
MMDAKKTILLVEDNPDDVFIFKLALQDANITTSVGVAVDGQEAVDYLSGANKYSDREQYPLPFIVFLDLKMPFLDGFEVLSWIRTQPPLRGIATVVLSGSDEAKDHEKADELGAGGYLIKPPEPQAILKFLDNLASDAVRK